MGINVKAASLALATGVVSGIATKLVAHDVLGLGNGYVRDIDDEATASDDVVDLLDQLVNHASNDGGSSSPTDELVQAFEKGFNDAFEERMKPLTEVMEKAAAAKEEEMKRQAEAQKANDERLAQVEKQISELAKKTTEIDDLKSLMEKFIKAQLDQTGKAAVNTQAPVAPNASENTMAAQTPAPVATQEQFAANTAAIQVTPSNTNTTVTVESTTNTQPQKASKPKKVK